MTQNKIIAIPSADTALTINSKLFLRDYFDTCEDDVRTHILFQCLAAATITALLGLWPELIGNDNFIVDPGNTITGEKPHINEDNFWWQVPLAWAPAALYYGLNKKGLCLDECISGGTFRRFSEYFPIVMMVKTTSQVLETSIDSNTGIAPYLAINILIYPKLFQSIIPDKIQPTPEKSILAPYTNIMKANTGKTLSLLITLGNIRALLELVYDKDPSYWAGTTMLLVPFLSITSMVLLSHLINIVQGQKIATARITDPTEETMFGNNIEERNSFKNKLYYPILSSGKHCLSFFKEDLKNNETPYSAVAIVHIISIIADLITTLSDTNYPWTVYISILSLGSIFLRCFSRCCPEPQLAARHRAYEETNNDLVEVVTEEPRPQMPQSPKPRQSTFV